VTEKGRHNDAGDVHILYANVAVNTFLFSGREIRITSQRILISNVAPVIIFLDVCFS
jgi:hypothetical protein